MTNPIRVLHVDDAKCASPVSGFSGREYDSIEVSAATDAEAGLDHLETDTVDCVVSDYDLPGTNGIEFLRAVRKDNPDLPFILLTDDGSEAVAGEAISAGATDYLRKEATEATYEQLVKRIEDAVTDSENTRRTRLQRREYQTLVDQAPVTMVVVSADGEIVYVNTTAIETLGGDTAEDIVGNDIETFLPEESLAETGPRIKRVLGERTPVDTREIQFVDLAGNVRYGHGTIVPVTFDGEPAAQAVVSDITERKKHKHRIQKQREQITNLHEVGVELATCSDQEDIYELMVDTAVKILDLDICVVGIVEDNRITLGASSTEMDEDGYVEPPVDSETAGLSGKAYREGESLLFGDLTESDVANPVKEYRSCLVTPIGDFGVFQAVSYEYEAFSETDLELVEILAGHVREALTRLEQQRQLREQRDQLQRENERLDEFASIISHDLRNPLNVAQLRLGLAKEDCESEHLEAVTDSVDRMETLTDELLTLARQGEVVTEFEAVPLDTVADQCWVTVETGEATLAGATDVVVRADRSRVQQVFENLMRNAVEHGSTNPASQTRQDAVEHGGNAITITIGRLDDGSGFYFEDDGTGMEPDVRDRAFESGFSTSESGTGFGLAIVARVAEAHSWELTVTDSEAGGARFEFRSVAFVDSNG